MLVPFIWMFLTAFKTETEATQMNPFVIFLLRREDRRLLGRSSEDGLCKIIYHAADDPGKDHMCGCDGYNGRICFWTAGLRGKNICFGLVLFQMMVPTQIFIIPQYLMVSEIGMLNTIFVSISSL